MALESANYIQLLDLDLQDLGDLPPKAANIGRMRCAGLPVPPSYLLRLDIKSWQNEGNQAKQHLLHLLPKIPRNLQNKASPHPFLKWCLRSASRLEDQQGQSSAGQQESLFDLPLDAGSLIRDYARIVRYIDSEIRALLAKDPASKSLALIAQAELRASVSGVAFSHHPMPALSHCISIEYSTGHGRHFTGGKSKPQRILLERRHGGVLAPQNVEKPLPSAANRWIDKLHHQITTLLALFGDTEPGLDIEWGRIGADIVLFQCRPVVAAGSGDQEQFLWNGELGAEFWSGEVSAFMFRQVGRSIENALLRRPLSILGDPALWQIPLLKRSHKRIFVNTRAIQVILHKLPGWARIPRLQEVAGQSPRWQIRPLFPLRFFVMAANFLKAGVRWLPWQMYQAMDQSQQQGQRMLNEHLQQAQNKLDRRELDQALRDIGTRLEGHLGRVLWGMVYAYVVTGLAEWVLARLGDKTERALSLLLAGNRMDPVHRLHLDLVTASCAVRGYAQIDHSHPAVVWMQQRYGHLTPDRDIASKRWFEAPELVERMLLGHPIQLPAISRTGALLRTVHELRSQAGWTRALLAFVAAPLLLWTRSIVAWRETMRMTSDLYLSCFSVVMNRATRSGVAPLDWSDCEDEQFVSRAADDVTSNMAPPVWLKGDQVVDPKNHRQQNKQLLAGVPVFHGIVEGIACTVQELIEGLHPDSKPILVADYLDPSIGPILPDCAGAVFEAGGTLSHGGILTREYQIPALTGVTGAVRMIPPGSKILLDTWHGSVQIIDRTDKTDRNA